MLKHGPRPPEGLISTICDEFTCTPDVAIRQDALLVEQIMTYRRARDAIRLFNAGKDGAEQLAQHPELLDLLLDLSRAQAGWPSMTLEQAMDGLAATRALQAQEKDED